MTKLVGGAHDPHPDDDGQPVTKPSYLDDVGIEADAERPIGGVTEPEKLEPRRVLGDLPLGKPLIAPSSPDESSPTKVVDIINAAVRPPGVTINLSPIAMRVLEEMQRLGLWGKNLDEIVTQLALGALRQEMVNFPILMPRVAPREAPRVQPVGAVPSGPRRPIGAR